jgi:LysM repeat protein
MIVNDLITYPAAGSKQVFTESRHRTLLKEDATYRKFHNLSRMLAERKMSEKEILDLFAAVEAGANASGQNRTALGRGKDAVAGAYTSAKDAINGVLNSITKSTPVAGVDAAYNDATGALRDALGGDSRIMDSIKKYRLLAKEYPKTQLFVKTALIALAGLATGGVGLPAIAGLTAAVDAAIKGEKLSSIIGKGAGAAVMALGAQEVNSMLAGDQGLGVRPSAASDFGAGTYDAGAAAADGAAGAAGAPAADFGTYTIMKGDQLGYIAQANGVSVEELRGLNPQIDFSKALQPGTELVLPPGGDNAGSVWQGYQGGMYGDKVPGPEQLGGVDASTASGAAATTPPQPMLNFTDGNSGTLTLPDGSQVEAYAFPQGGMQPRLGPGTESVQVNYAGQDVTAYIKNGKAYIKNFNPEEFSNPVQESWLPAVALRTLPASELINRWRTASSWSLLESTNYRGRSVHLTHRGVLTVFENVDRYRKAIVEAAGPGREQLPDLYRKDMPGAPVPQTAQPGAVGRGLNWLDRTAGKVGGYLSKQAQNFTRKVTAAKLKTEWEQLGHITDSDQIAAFLAKQGVPQPVINDVYNNMGIPLTAPAALPSDAQTKSGTAKRSAYTNNPYAVDSASAATAADAETDTATAPADAETDTATAPTSAFGNMARQLDARGQAQTSTGGATIATGRGVRHAANPLNPNQQVYPSATKPAATQPATKPAAQPAAQAQPAVGSPASFNATNVMKMPGMEKYAKPATPAKTPNFAGPSGYGAVKTSFKPPALTNKQLQVAESLTWSKDFDPGMTLLKKMRK